MSWVSRPMAMIAGGAIVLSVVAVFAFLFSSTGIGGAAVSTDMVSTQTGMNSALPYIVLMLACAAGFSAFVARKKR